MSKRTVLIISLFGCQNGFVLRVTSLPAQEGAKERDLGSSLQSKLTVSFVILRWCKRRARYCLCLEYGISCYSCNCHKKLISEILPVSTWLKV